MRGDPQMNHVSLGRIDGMRLFEHLMPGGSVRVKASPGVDDLAGQEHRRRRWAGRVPGHEGFERSRVGHRTPVEEPHPPASG
jgi:hypothetical protein